MTFFTATLRPDTDTHTLCTTVCTTVCTTPYHGSQESKHVSEHLHQWIDLVWGHKQLGEAAQEALNVFHPLTYEGYVDIDAMTDEVLKASTICQIHNFGQVRALYTLHFTLHFTLYTLHI